MNWDAFWCHGYVYSNKCDKIKMIFKGSKFYQLYFKNFVVKTAPMCKLLKDIYYWWDEACKFKGSFQLMKTTLITLSGLIIPN